MGGAQAVAALAYGTATLPAVDKIVGPGNLYVALAKRLVFGDVGIDLIAGPSEVVVVADRTAEATHVAADLLAQAEHDPMARGGVPHRRRGARRRASWRRSPGSARVCRGRPSRSRPSAVTARWW